MIKDRTANIRIRTWSLTAVIIVALVMYFLVQVVFNEVNYVDLCFIAFIQIAMHCLYFPEGELYGQKDGAFIRNKHVYNLKATAINENRKVAELREYCKFEYEERKKAYILAECGAIGITLEEFEALKQKSESEIKKLEKIELGGKITFFSKAQRKRLHRLIFSPIPVEENSPELILSAVEHDTGNAIRDTSIKYKEISYIKKIFLAIVVGTFLAYVGYTTRDGVTLAVIAQIIVYLANMFITSVFSFSRGETCSKVHKNKFYIDLSNYIDEFLEWLEKTKQTKIEIKD